MNYSFALADKNHLEPILPKLFKLLNTNMGQIAPTGNSYDQDYEIWHSGICTAMQQPCRQIVLMYCDEDIVGYFQYDIHSDTLMMEEIQIEQSYQGKGIFSALYSWLVRRLPSDIKTVEAYAHKKNAKSKGILEHLGLQQIGVSKNGNSYHYKGDCCDLRRKYTV